MKSYIVGTHCRSISDEYPHTSVLEDNKFIQNAEIRVRIHQPFLRTFFAFFFSFSLHYLQNGTQHNV